MRRPQKQILYLCLVGLALIIPNMISKWGPYLSLAAGFVLLISIQTIEMTRARQRGFPVVLNQDAGGKEPQKPTEEKPAQASLETQQNFD